MENYKLIKLNCRRLFDYIHSVDSEKLAKKIADEQNKINKKIKIFIQVNIGNEKQKSGIRKNEIKLFYKNCCKELKFKRYWHNVHTSRTLIQVNYFKEMNKLNQIYNFKVLSMGMSSDYLIAVKNKLYIKKNWY